MLNGDILEYEGAVVTADEQVAIAALIALGAGINLFFPRLLRIRGGMPINFGPLVMSAGKALGPTGRDFVFRHFFTGNYRRMVQDIANEDVRGLVADYQRKRVREVEVGRAAARLKYPGIPTKKFKLNPVIMDRELRGRRYFRSGAAKSSSRKYQVGANVLAMKNETQRMFHSKLFYEMSPILYTGRYGNAGAIYVHKLAPGQGPHLYSGYFTGMTQAALGGIRNYSYGNLLAMDVGGFGATPVVGSSMFIGERGTVYVFVLNWPFAIMNTDENTQVEPTSDNVRDGQCLRWEYLEYNTTTSDMNVPRQLNFVVANTAWSYFTHYRTRIDMVFTNNYWNPYTVEVLIFKFKADVDAMNYEKQAKAVIDLGGEIEDYCNGFPQMFNAPDIFVLKRRRFIIPGMSTITPTAIATPQDFRAIPNNNTPRSNELKYSYTSNKQYVIRRPIVNTLNTSMTEGEFFRTYFDRQKGIYCRLQAWPTQMPIVANMDIKPYSDVRDNAINQINATSTSGTTMGSGVTCYMTKKSSWKLDQNVGA